PRSPELRGDRQDGDRLDGEASDRLGGDDRLERSAWRQISLDRAGRRRRVHQARRQDRAYDAAHQPRIAHRPVHLRPAVRSAAETERRRGAAAEVAVAPATGERRMSDSTKRGKLDIPTWRTPEGELVSCLEKIKVLNENLEELRALAQEAL